MTTCHSIELIGYQILEHCQNNCTVLITKDQSSKCVSIFQCSYWLLFNQSVMFKQQRTRSVALRWRSPRVKFIVNFRNPWYALVSQHLRNTQAKFLRLNDAWSLTELFCNFLLRNFFKKLAIHIFFRNVHFLAFPAMYSLPCCPLKWCAYECFPEAFGSYWYLLINTKIGSSFN